MNPVYDVDYFIAKFEAIPEDKWGRSELSYDDGRCCVLGHCGLRSGGEFDYGRPSEEAKALGSLLLSLPLIGSHYAPEKHYENDGPFTRAMAVCWKLNDSWKEFGSEPRERVLNALREIKAKQDQLP
jgi:hypothetical protein